MAAKNNDIQEPTAEPGQTQPWRDWWPPSETSVQNMTEEERKAQPWVGWQPDPKQPNAKPWLQWVPRDAHIVSQNTLEKASGLGSASDANPDPKPDAPATPVTAPPSSNAEGG